jgi:hypothetical protein
MARATAFTYLFTVLQRSPTAPLAWANRLKRVFEIDISVCPRCGGTLRIIANITDPDVIRSILDHTVSNGHRQRWNSPTVPNVPDIPALTAPIRYPQTRMKLPIKIPILSVSSCYLQDSRSSSKSSLACSTSSIVAPPSA